MATVQSSTEKLFFFQGQGPNVGLSDELIIKILSYLGIQSIGAAARCCKKMENLANDEVLWKQLCLRDFSNQSKESNERWKSFYQKYLLVSLNIPFRKEDVFRLKAGDDWTPHYSSAPLIRELCFETETKGSLVHKISLLGYKEGSIALSLTFNESSSFKTYLKRIKEEENPATFAPKAFIFVQKIDAIRKIFKDISCCCNLPEEKLKLMREIISAGNWEAVTPLTQKEIQMMVLQREQSEKRTWGEWIVDKITVFLFPSLDKIFL